MRFFSIIVVVAMMVLFVDFYSSKSSLIYCLNRIDFETCVIENNCDSQVIKIDKNNCKKLLKNLSVEINKKYELGNRIIIEGYTNKLNDYILINNIKTNLQISIFEDDCLVGYPLIKNSF